MMPILPVTTQKIRLYVYSTSAGSPAISEIEAYNAAHNVTSDYLIINDDDTGMTYSGTWTDENNAPDEYNNDKHYTMVNNNYVQYSFTGTGIDYITDKANDLGNVDIYIDGSLDSTVNCYNATRIQQASVYSKTGLSLGTHTIKLVKKDGSYMGIDDLKVYSTASGYTMVNDKNASLVYSGTWTVDSNAAGEYDNDKHWTQTNGDYVQYSFTGTGVDYITDEANDLGNVDIYIDGNFDSTVNCYNPARIQQVTVYSKTGLSSGTHTIKLVKKDGGYMGIDALKIYQ